MSRQAEARTAGRTSTKGDPFNANMHAERNDRWLTPRFILDALGEFDLDPCGAPGHPTAKTVWTPEEIGDGLSLPWEGRVWLNPPYGREQRPWMEALAAHGTGTALIPAATGTILWQEVVFPRADAILFYRHRVNFLRADGIPDNKVAAAPSALIAFGRRDVDALVRSGLPGYWVRFDGLELAPAPGEAPKRIQLSRRAGARLPGGAVSVARPTRWGNPFVVGTATNGGNISRREAVRQHRRALFDGRLQVSVADVKRELAGRDLACWCGLSDPCHADTLLEVANS